jgi:hypothetical protein
MIGRWGIVLILAGVWCSAGAETTKPTKPGDPGYLKIPERNLFGLHDPPPASTETQKEEAPLPKVTLNGIATILGRKQAFMTLPAGIGKPGQPAKEESFALAVGERDGPLEVLDINDKAGSVKIKNSGKQETLTFERNGVKGQAPPPVAGSAAAAVAGTIPPPPAGQTAANLENQGQIPGVQPTGSNWLKSRIMPTRSGGFGSAMNGANSNTLPAVAVPTPTGSTSGIPVRAEGNSLTPEQEAILRELEKEKANSPRPSP